MKPGSSGAARGPRLILYSLVLLAFSLRLWHLDYQSLWRDEMDAIVFARQDLSQLLPLFVTPGHNGPLYYVLLHAWVGLAGDSEFAVRFLSLLCGVLAVPVIYLVGRQWMGRRASLAAALLGATSPYLIWYGQEGKMYSLLLLLSVLSTYVYILALNRNRPYLWACYVGLVAVSMYVHLLAVLILPVHFLLFFVTWPRWRGAWKGWLGAFVVLVLPALPLARWEVALLVGPFTTGHQFYSLPQMLAILLHAFSLNVAPHANVPVTTLFVFVLLAGLALPRRGLRTEVEPTARQSGDKQRERVFLALYLFLPVLCLFAISLGMPIFTDRYLITVVPAFLLLLGRGLAQVRARWTPFAVACMGLVLISNLYVVVLQSHTPIKSDFRSAAHYVAEDGRGELLVFLIPQVRPVFDYYSDDSLARADAPYTNGGLTVSGLAGQMATLTEGREEVWLIVSEAELWDARGLVQEWFENHGRLLERRSFARVDTILYSLHSET